MSDLIHNQVRDCDGMLKGVAVLVVCEKSLKLRKSRGVVWLES